MHEPTYRQAISNSWKLVWHHKYLWFFGMFATLLGQMGLMELFGKMSFTSIGDMVGGESWWLLLFRGLSNVSLSVAGWTWLAWLVVFSVGVMIILLFVSVSSQGVLIHASAEWAKKEKVPEISKSWHKGTSHFWSLLLINLFKKLVIGILASSFGIFIIKSFMAPTSSGDLFLFLLLFIVVAIVGMIVSFLAIYTAGYVVVENYPLTWAFPAAWKMFVKHWLVSVEAGLIILCLNILLSIVAVFGLLIVGIPTYLTWFITTFGGGNTFWFLLSSMMPLLFVILIVWLGSVFTAFTTSIWTYLFMKMHKGGLVSRVLHFLGR